MTIACMVTVLASCRKPSDNTPKTVTNPPVKPVTPPVYNPQPNIPTYPSQPPSDGGYNHDDYARACPDFYNNDNQYGRSNYYSNNYNVCYYNQGQYYYYDDSKNYDDEIICGDMGCFESNCAKVGGTMAYPSRDGGILVSENGAFNRASSMTFNLTQAVRGGNYEVYSFDIKGDHDNVRHCQDKEEYFLTVDSQNMPATRDIKNGDTCTSRDPEWRNHLYTTVNHGTIDTRNSINQIRVSHAHANGRSRSDSSNHSGQLEVHSLTVKGVCLVPKRGFKRDQLPGC